MDDLPRGLLTREWLRRVEGDESGAGEDLDEAWEIAERGSMRLFMADVQLTRARLSCYRSALGKAKELIEKCGYRRRDVAETGGFRTAELILRAYDQLRSAM